MLNSLNPVPNVSTKCIQNPALPKIPTTKRSSRKRIFQEEEHLDFIANDTISLFNNVIEKNCPGDNILIRCDNYFMQRKQITSELHVPEVRECIRIDLELLVKLFFTRSSGSLPQWFRYGHNCKLTKKSTPENFLPFLSNQGENFFISEELLYV